MNHYVAFERQTTDKNTMGQREQVWENIGYAFAAVAPVNGRAYFAASGEKAEITHEIRTRHQSLGVRPRDRVNFRGRYFEIRSVINEGERDRFLVLMCVERLQTDG